MTFQVGQSIHLHRIVDGRYLVAVGGTFGDAFGGQKTVGDREYAARTAQVACPEFQEIDVADLVRRLESFQEINHVMDLVDGETASLETFCLASGQAPAHFAFGQFRQDGRSGLVIFRPVFQDMIYLIIQGIHINDAVDDRRCLLVALNGGDLGGAGCYVKQARFGGIQSLIFQRLAAVERRSHDRAFHLQQIIDQRRETDLY